MNRIVWRQATHRDQLPDRLRPPLVTRAVRWHRHIDPRFRESLGQDRAFTAQRRGEIKAATRITYLEGVNEGYRICWAAAGFLGIERQRYRLELSRAPRRTDPTQGCGSQIAQQLHLRHHLFFFATAQPTATAHKEQLKLGYKALDLSSYGGEERVSNQDLVGSNSRGFPNRPFNNLDGDGVDRVAVGLSGTARRALVRSVRLAGLLPAIILHVVVLLRRLRASNFRARCDHRRIRWFHRDRRRHRDVGVAGA